MTRGRSSGAFQQTVHSPEWTIVVLHEHAPDDIDYQDVLENEVAAARQAGWEVEGPQDGGLRVQVLDDLLLVPDVVPGGDHVHSRIQKLIRCAGGKPESPGAVLGVSDNEINPELVLDARKQGAHGAPSRLADYVADHQYSHLGAPAVVRDRTSGEVMRPSFRAGPGREMGTCINGNQRAVPRALVSRMMVTLISPG